MPLPGYAFEQPFAHSKRHLALVLHHVVVGGLAVFAIVKNPSSAGIIAPSAIGAVGLAQSATSYTSSQTDRAQAESPNFPVPPHMAPPMPPAPPPGPLVPP